MSMQLTIKRIKTVILFIFYLQLLIASLVLVIPVFSQELTFCSSLSQETNILELVETTRVSDLGFLVQLSLQQEKLIVRAFFSFF